MKDRPILFNGEMVNAVLDGRKTQTRRVVKPQPSRKLTEGWHFTAYNGCLCAELDQDSDSVDAVAQYYEDGVPHIRCPYGVVGDRLWVRETFSGWSEEELVIYRADGSDYLSPCDYTTGGYPDHCRHHPGCEGCEPERVVWKPSIFMPRWASRITLEVTAVRVERVQEITAEDAKAEGIPDHYHDCPHGPPQCSTYVGCFAKLWDSINGKPRKDGVDISWVANPWVWVVEFKRLDTAP